MKKIPPYGKALYNLQKSGNPPTNSINIWIGLNAWKKGQAFVASYPSRTLVLPPWENPLEFYWPVNFCDVLIHDMGGAEEEYIEDLVFELYKCGADIVRYLAPNLTLSIYTKGFASHAR